MIIPDTLVGVSNGRLQWKKSNGDGTQTVKWAVVNPISNYCLIPYIGKYVTFHEDFQGEKGHLDLDYWVLDYNLTKAKGKPESYLPLERIYSNKFPASHEKMRKLPKSISKRNQPIIVSRPLFLILFLRKACWHWFHILVSNT